MSVKKTILFLLIVTQFFLLFATEDTGHKTLTVNEKTVVEMAVNYSFSLKMSQVDVKILKNAKDTGWNNYIPSLSFSAGINRNGSAFLPPSTQKPQTESDKWTMSASLGASISLSSSSYSIMKKTVREYEVGIITYADAVKKIETDIKKSFYELLVRAEDARISSSVLINAEKKYRQDAENYLKGLISEMMLLRSQVTYENAKADVTSRAYSYETALTNFRDALGIERDTKLVLEGTIDPILVEFKPEELISKYLYNRADIKKALLELDRLKAERTDALIAAYTPSLNASYSLNFGNMLQIPSGSEFTDAASVNLSLKIPLDMFIPGTKEKNKFFDRAANIEKQKIKLEQTISSAINDIYRMVAQLERSAASLLNLQVAEKIAQRSYNITYATYQKGEIPYYNDVTDAEYALESARQRVLSELYTYRSVLLDLEYALNTVFI